MAIKMSTSGTSNLIANLADKLASDAGGALKGGDGDQVVETAKTLKKAAANLASDAGQINKMLDEKLSVMLSMDKGAAQDIQDDANKSVSKIGTVTKKH